MYIIVKKHLIFKATINFFLQKKNYTTKPDGLKNNIITPIKSYNNAELLKKAIHYFFIIFL
jgi:hypothetical protein